MLRRVLIFTIWLVPMGISAGDWTVSRGVTVKETYTDNLRLEDSDKESEWITEISPSIGLHGKGRRINVDLDYSFRYLNYLQESSNRGYHQLGANSTIELIKDHFFVDVDASVGQTLIDSFGRASDDAVNRTGNIETTSTYSVNPRYVANLGGDYATVETSFTSDGLLASKSSDDSVSNKGAITVKSGPKFTTIPWSMTAEYEDVDYSDSSDQKYKSVTGQLGYVFSRQWRVNGSVGYEDNTYTTTTGSDTSGTIWDARLTWTPNPRTSLTVGTGHRYIGNTPTLDFSHRSKRTTWTASYQKEVSDFRTARLTGVDAWQWLSVRDRSGNLQYFPLYQDQFGNPTRDPASGIPYIDAVFLPSIGSDVFISERFQTSIAIDGNRSNLGISAFYEQRDYEVSAKTEDVLGASLHGSHKVTGQTSATANLSWQRDEQSDDPLSAQDRDITTWRAGLGLSRPLSSHMTGNVQYQYSDRDSNVADDNYSENRLWMSVSANWK